MKEESNHPLVSIIVPTYNSSNTIDACLKSIKDQNYKNIELVVVDNNSQDDTKKIALKYTNHEYNKGPERSAQRNYGVKICRGYYVMIIDSDMQLSPDVTEQCVYKLSRENAAGVIIPEESFGIGFWAQCKRLERSYYVGVDWIEAARFFRRDLYQKIGGYNVNLISGEDWDLSQRMSKIGSLARINAFIYHDEGNLRLLKTLKKKFYYSQNISKYTDSENNIDHEVISKQTNPLSRYQLYFSDINKLFKKPHVGFGMLFMKTLEFLFGGFGIVLNKVKL